jgi:hypothetical protein
MTVDKTIAGTKKPLLPRINKTQHMNITTVPLSATNTFTFVASIHELPRRVILGNPYAAP